MGSRSKKSKNQKRRIVVEPVERDEIDMRRLARVLLAIVLEREFASVPDAFGPGSPQANVVSLGGKLAASSATERSSSESVAKTGGDVGGPVDGDRRAA